MALPFLSLRYVSLKYSTRSLSDRIEPVTSQQLWVWVSASVDGVRQGSAKSSLQSGGMLVIGAEKHLIRIVELALLQDMESVCHYSGSRSM